MELGSKLIASSSLHGVHICLKICRCSFDVPMTRPLFAEDMDWISGPGHARKPGRVHFREERSEFRGQKQFQSEVIFKVGVSIEIGKASRFLDPRRNIRFNSFFHPLEPVFAFRKRYQKTFVSRIKSID